MTMPIANTEHAPIRDITRSTTRSLDIDNGGQIPTLPQNLDAIVDYDELRQAGVYIAHNLPMLIAAFAQQGGNTATCHTGALSGKPYVASHSGKVRCVELCSQPSFFLILDRLLSEAILCHVFGGHVGDGHSAQDEISPSEHKYLTKFANQIIDILKQSDTDFGSSVIMPGKATIVCPSDFSDNDTPVTYTRIVLSISEDVTTYFDIVRPGQGSLPATHDVVSEIPDEWRKSLNNAIQQLDMPIRARFKQCSMRFSRLASLAVGDLLHVESFDTIELESGNRIIGYGQLGTIDEFAALKINKINH